METPTQEYVPAPVDTSDIVIPADLSELQEEIAENAHDMWAVEKMRQGYVYGPVTDNDSEPKTHTDLLPYGDLTEDTKESRNCDWYTQVDSQHGLHHYKSINPLWECG